MQSVIETVSWRTRYPVAEYVAPFVLFLLFLAASPKQFSAYWEAPLWVLVLGVVCWVCWPRNLPASPRYPLLSITVGLLVFCIWVAPDLLVPGYRLGPLFSNSIVGHLHSSIQPAELRSHWVLAWRTARAALIVPVVEELFWRAWLMRWLINSDFRKVPLGTCSALSFWIVAVLFASEHGPYWDVGLITGVIYNAWMIRTKSVSDCILMHGITNAALSIYVIATAQWQYWQ